MDFLAGQDVLTYLKDNVVIIRPQLVLILWGLVILCVMPLLHRGRTFYAFMYAVIGLLVAGFDVWWGSQSGIAFNGMVVFDSFTRYFQLLFVVGCLISALLSYHYLEIENEHRGEYYALLLFSTAGMMFLAGAIELITILVGLELMAIPTYILVGFLRGKRRSNEGAMKYFLLGAFSTGMILYGMSLMYGIAGTTKLTEIGTALTVQALSPLLVLSVFLIIIGFCFKVAAAPFHMWVPDAYEGAPTAVTAFMSVGVKAAAFAIFFRICFVALGDVREIYVPILTLIAILTMTWGNLAAVTQTNLKRLFAYSSISHAGYVLMGLVAGSEYGIVAAAVYLFIYTFMNLGVLAVLILMRRVDIQGEDIESFKGMMACKPLLAILMLLFLLSLGGIPPLGGFIAKYFVFAAVIKEALTSSGSQAIYLVVLAIFGALNAVVALYYYLRIVVIMFFEDDFVPSKLAFSVGVFIVLCVSGLLTLLTGIYPQPFIELARTAAVPLL